MATVRVVKRKWDGTLSAVDTASRLAVPGDSWAWLVLAGSRRELPDAGTIEVLGSDEVWVAVPGQWWCSAGTRTPPAPLTGYEMHAAAPFEAPRSDDEIVWIDLDLDFEVTGDEVEIDPHNLIVAARRLKGAAEHASRSQ